MWYGKNLANAFVESLECFQPFVAFWQLRIPDFHKFSPVSWYGFFRAISGRRNLKSKRESRPNTDMLIVEGFS
jgi:hypothetical protein